MQVADMTVEELKTLIRDTVTETLESLLNLDSLNLDSAVDPDEGLEIRPEVVRQLRDALQHRRDGERGTPAAVAAKELGIDWDEL